jgi:hypothetical protein
MGWPHEHSLCHAQSRWNSRQSSANHPRPPSGHGHMALATARSTRPSQVNPARSTPTKLPMPHVTASFGEPAQQPFGIPCLRCRAHQAPILSPQSPSVAPSRFRHRTIDQHTMDQRSPAHAPTTNASSPRPLPRTRSRWSLAVPHEHEKHFVPTYKIQEKSPALRTG